MEQFNTGSTKKEILQLLGAYQQAIDFNIICSITDIKGTILYANKKFCEISKYSEDELVGQNHRIVNSGFHPKDFFKQMWKTIGKGNVWHNEVKNKAKDGTYYWVDTIVLPIYGKNGKIIQYFSLRIPINEKKQLEQDQIERIKELKEMLFMTSHKVRKPVSSCLGLMNLVESDIPISQDELWKIIGHLKSSALELDAFTRELTTFIYDLEQKEKNRNRAYQLS